MVQRVGSPDEPSPLATRVVVAPGDTQLPWPVESAWRAAVPTTTGLASMEEILRRARPVPLAVRAERNLLSALAADDGHAVMEHAARPGDHQLAAAVLAGLRMAAHVPDRALSLLAWARSSSFELGALRFMRRYIPNLMVLAEVGPSVRLWTVADNAGLGMLEAELLDRLGRSTEALAVRQSLPSPDLRLLSAALDLARSGLHQQVIGIAHQAGARTDDIGNLLGILSARAVLATGDAGTALDQFNELASVPGLEPSMRVWVVRGQQEALAALGRHAEAELAGAEHIALADRLEGRETADSPRPSPPSSSSSAAMASPHAPETSITLPPGPTAAPLLGGRTLVAALEDAHARVRRQPRWSEAPGTLGGRPQEDFQAEVDELIAGAHLQAAESLLLALLDCLDDAVDAGLGLDPMHYITLAGLFAQQMMPFEELATLTRLAEAFRRSGQEPPAAVMQQIESVEASIARLTEA